MSNSSPSKYQDIENEHQNSIDDQNIHGQDNQEFLTDDTNNDIKQFNKYSNHNNNLQVSFHKDSSTVDINPCNSSLPSYDNNQNEQSSYEEVAANVSNKDDPTMSVLTFRSWLLGLTFTCILSFVNQFFFYRTSPLIIGVLVAQLLSHLLGKLMAKILPHRKFRIFRWNFSFNPGPFTVKEHCIITTMAATAAGTAYAIDVVTIQRLFYKRTIHPGIGIIFVITSQILGYGMAGIMRRFLVWPAAMIWPANLVNCALFRTLHNDKDNEDNNERSNWRTSRLKFFFLAFLFQFLWYWFPGYIFPVLSAFSWICMIKPDNILLSQLTGIYGLGIGSIELDWNAWVAFLGSPIVVPFWAQVNILVGFVVLAWIIAPAAYYSNLWNSKALPIVSVRVFNENGHFYNISAVLNSNLRLNETAYKQYGMSLLIRFMIYLTAQ
ncbi:unnamed protein product [Rotaria sordida]|uniref:Uncharacterized protein n=1 Tax=Rotaria sordida TaxID=392033 RepID=A0A815G488_9BILA|nr:unnamed protein product [Rotaria sordida]